MSSLRIEDRRPWPARVLDSLEDSRSAWLALLRPLGWCYGTITACHERLRPRRRLPLSPLSVTVGNLRVGGTGKTPVVAWLSAMLQKKGVRVAVVSRGYRAEGGGDEPLWIEKEIGVPVILNHRRDEGFERARQQGAQAVLLDDGLQARDQGVLRMAIVLARDLLQSPRLLPEGPLREPMKVLKDMDVVLVRRERSDPLATDLLKLTARWCPQSMVFRLKPVALRDAEGGEYSLDQLSQRGPCLLVSGLARPSSFENDALAAGADASAVLRFADHVSFTAQEAEEISSLAKAVGARWILCPEKNLQRLSVLRFSLGILALRSEVEWEAGGSPLELVLSRMD